MGISVDYVRGSDGGAADGVVGSGAFEDGGAYHPTLHTIAEHEIYAGQNPKMDVVVVYLCERSTVGVHPYETLYAPCGGHTAA